MADTTSPALVSLSPAHQATAVPVDADIVLSFDEPVVRGAGVLFVFDVFGNLMFDTDASGGAVVTAVGSQIRIDPSLDLPGNVEFQVATSAGLALDAAGNLSFPLPVYRFTTASDPQDPYRYGTAGDDTFTPDGAQRTFVGGPGLDRLTLGTTHGVHTVSQAGNRHTLTDATAGTTYDVMNIERVQFSDARLALDLDGHAGWVAQILGAVFGRASVANAQYVGIGLQVADAGAGYDDLVAYALQARFAAPPDHTTLVRTLYTNVAGVEPSAEETAMLVGWLDGGLFTPVELGAFAAQHPANLIGIDLAGLAETGLLYTV